MISIMRQPRICCLDLDTFFVSVERLLDPTLEGRPVVVGARPGHRGVVVAASYEVRPLGVRAGMPMSEAVRRAPHATFRPPRAGVYGGYASRVRAVLERYSPAVQTASIDEFYIDFHGCDELLRRPGDANADDSLRRSLREIGQRIAREVGLPASSGVGCTRAVAKMASGLAKPNQALEVDDGRGLGSGLVLVPAGAEREWLGALPLRRFPGIGPVAERRLSALGLHRIEDLLALPKGPALDATRGTRDRLLQALDGETPRLGRDRPAFREHDELASTLGTISNESTFGSDLPPGDDVERRLLGLVERVCWRARKRGVRARTVSLKLRYRDFDTTERSHTRAAPTSDDEPILRAARRLLRLAWTRRMPIRLLGVRLSNLVAPDRQLALPFEGPPSSASQAVDRVRHKFGYAAIGRGGAQRTGLAAPGRS